MNRYLPRKFRVYPIDEEYEFLSCTGADVALRVPKPFRALLAACRGFHTIDEFVVHASEALRIEVAKVRPQIEEAIRLGLFVSEAEVHRAAGDAASDGDPKPLTLVIPTANRHAKEVRCARSLLQHFPSEQISIIDYSSIPLTPPSDLTRRVNLVSRDDLSRMVESVVDRSSRELLSFALGLGDAGPGAYGATRNAALLLRCGQHVLSLDDDTVFRPLVSGDVSQGAILSSEPLPVPFRFFRSEAHLAANTAPYADWQPYLSLVGAHPLRGAEAILMCDKAHEDLIDAVASPTAKLPLLTLGLAGDHGGGGGASALLYEGETRANLLQNERFFRDVLKSRLITRLPPCLTLGRGGTFQSTAFLADCSLLLLPFLPIGRGEDSLFGQMLVHLFPSYVIGYAPFGISHLPDRRVGPSTRFWEDGIQQHLSRLVLNMLMDFLDRTPLSDPISNLSGFGTYLISLASLDIRKFHSHILHIHWRGVSGLIQLLLGREREYREAPKFWRMEVRAYRNALSQSFEFTEDALPRDFLPQLPGQLRLERLERFLESYGDLIVNWNALRSALTGIGYRAAPMLP